jgi:hypothetical protein
MDDCNINDKDFFTMNGKDFFLAKCLGKRKKSALLHWIKHQDNSFFLIYEDHVKMAYKNDGTKYPFTITSNRGHLYISREALNIWENKFKIKELNENQIMETDPENCRVRRYIGSIVEKSILDDLQSLITKRMLEITDNHSPVSLNSTNNSSESETNMSSINKSKKKKICPQLIGPLNIQNRLK